MDVKFCRWKVGFFVWFFSFYIDFHDGAASLGEDIVGQVIALALKACGTDSKVFPALVWGFGWLGFL